MSWNSTFIAIKRDYSAQSDKLMIDLGIVLDEPLRQISWEEATSSAIGGTSVGFCNGWTIICDPFMFLNRNDFEPPEEGKIWSPQLERGLEICSIGSRALGFILSGVSDTYGLTVHEDGKLVRCRLVQEGATLFDFGEPSPDEVEIFNQESDEEYRVFLFLKKNRLTSDELNLSKFTLYQSEV